MGVFVFLIFPVQSMAFDPYNQQHRERLFKARDSSRTAMEPFQVPRNVMIRDFAGSYYVGGTPGVYVNKLNTTANIYQMALAYNNPQVKVTTFKQWLWPFARKFEINVNRIIENIDLKTTLQECLLDAFFLVGIVKVRMADTGEEKNYPELDPDLWIDPGQPWAGRVSFDDAILDMSARGFRRMRFFGDRYRASLERTKARKDFNEAVREVLVGSSKFDRDQAPIPADQIGTGYQCDDDELEPMLWLEDIFIPETQQLCTFVGDPGNQANFDPLKVQDYKGHPTGPYCFLSLGFVPDNIIPNAPAMNLKGLNDAGNDLYRKLVSQAKRQKNTVAYPMGADDDAERGRKARDGQYFAVRDPKSLQPVNFPGIDPQTHAFFLALQEVYNVQSGNERVIGGLGTEGPTKAQAEMVESHASGRIGWMKGQFNYFAADISRKLGDLMWDDEDLTVNSSMDVGGQQYDSSWTPDERKGLRDYYDFCVEPNSMAYLPPEAKMGKIMQFVQGVGTVFPLVQAGVLDIEEFTRLFSEYENLPEVQKIFKYMASASQGEETQGDHGATKPANTSREIVRRNSGQGPTGGGLQAVLGQMMQHNSNQNSLVGAGR